MKKTIIISTIALVFSLTNVDAMPVQQTEDFSISLLEDYRKPNALCMSIIKGDIDMVKKLIALGADVNEKSNGKTPAIFAARYNKVEILKLLISKGADLKKKCDKGMTPAKYAELSNSKEAMAIIDSELKKKKRNKKKRNKVS